MGGAAPSPPAAAAPVPHASAARSQPPSIQTRVKWSAQSLAPLSRASARRRCHAMLHAGNEGWSPPPPPPPPPAPAATAGCVLGAPRVRAAAWMRATVSLPSPARNAQQLTSSAAAFQFPRPCRSIASRSMNSSLTSHQCFARRAAMASPVSSAAAATAAASAFDSAVATSSAARWRFASGSADALSSLSTAVRFFPFRPPRRRPLLLLLQLDFASASFELRVVFGAPATTIGAVRGATFHSIAEAGSPGARQPNAPIGQNASGGTCPLKLTLYGWSRRCGWMSSSSRGTGGGSFFDGDVAASCFDRRLLRLPTAAGRLNFDRNAGVDGRSQHARHVVVMRLRQAASMHRTCTLVDRSEKQRQHDVAKSAAQSAAAALRWFAAIT